MAITTQDFVTIVRNQVTAIQGAASSLVDLTVGSILRAMVEANAAVVLWLQGLILQLLATTRAATSSAADLDSWVADYGVIRLAGVAATGQVTFSRFTATQQAEIPVGSSVQTADGSQVFTVTADTTNPAYSATIDSYVIAVGVTSVNVPVQASVAGAGANVSIGQINTITHALPGVDTVSNAAAFVNGADAESDAALRTRFVAFVASLSKATKGAIGYAITSLQSGLSYSLTENENYAGATQMGYFFVVVDDGTGVPGSTLLSTVSNAIDAVRPACSTFGVFAPVVVTANVNLTIVTAAGYTHSAEVATVAAALTNYINSLAMGQSLPWSKLAQIAYDASPGVTNVTGVTLNSGTADLSATSKHVIKAGTVAVS
jgi:uncharacterized phage protein gp47/JayE